MRQWIDKKNNLTKKLREWKKEQKIKSLTPDEMRELLEEEQTAIIEYKMDGELAFFHKSGETVRFASLQGRIREELPVLEAMYNALDKHKIDKIQIIGELIGLDENGEPLRFNETISIIRDPTEDEEKRIAFYPFEVYSVEGEKIDNTKLDEYEKWMDRIDEIFEDIDLVRPVYRKRGLIKTFNQMWSKWAEKEKQEGLIIRLEGGRIYKVKTSFNFDAAIIFVTRGTKRLSNTMGAAGVALMDEDKIFHYIGLVGTGWTDEFRDEVWEFAQKNKAEVREEGWRNPPRTTSKDIIWVKPEIVIEVKWKDILEHWVPGYSYSRGVWSFTKEVPSVIMREPRFVRFRDDKTVNPSDLRLEQIPDWAKIVRRLEKEKREEIKGDKIKEAACNLISYEKDSTKIDPVLVKKFLILLQFLMKEPTLRVLRKLNQIITTLEFGLANKINLDGIIKIIQREVLYENIDTLSKKDYRADSKITL